MHLLLACIISFTLLAEPSEIVKYTYRFGDGWKMTVSAGGVENLQSMITSKCETRICANDAPCYTVKSTNEENCACVVKTSIENGSITDVVQYYGNNCGKVEEVDFEKSFGKDSRITTDGPDSANGYSNDLVHYVYLSENGRPSACQKAASENIIFYTNLEELASVDQNYEHINIILPPDITTKSSFQIPFETLQQRNLLANQTSSIFVRLTDDFHWNQELYSRVISTSLSSLNIEFYTPSDIYSTRADNECIDLLQIAALIDIKNLIRQRQTDD